MHSWDNRGKIKQKKVLEQMCDLDIWFVLQF